MTGRVMQGAISSSTCESTSLRFLSGCCMYNAMAGCVKCHLLQSPYTAMTGVIIFPTLPRLVHDVLAFSDRILPLPRGSRRGNQHPVAPILFYVVGPTSDQRRTRVTSRRSHIPTDREQQAQCRQPYPTQVPTVQRRLPQMTVNH